MMKFKFALLLILGAIVMWSCKKITNVEVTNDDTKGGLTYKLIDAAGKGLPGIKISLYTNGSVPDGSYGDPRTLTDTLRTDQNGIAKFSAMNAGNYLLIADSVKSNNIQYVIREFVQVVAGVNKEKETKTTDFYGTVNVFINSQRNGNPLPNIGVAAISSLRYPVFNSGKLNSIIDEAEFKGVTDPGGRASIRIPSDSPYYITIYTLNKGIIASYTANTFTVGRYFTVALNYTFNPGY